MRANVQLEHGYVRMANHLLEAILANQQFTGAQVRILLALVRLTYGWGRKTVVCSVRDLARSAGVASPHGNFRASLNELVKNNVVLQLTTGGGSERSTWAIQKDFTKWKSFQVGPDFLAGRYSARPEHDDDLMRQGDIFIDGDGSAPTEAGSEPLEGQGVRPLKDRGSVPKSSSGETYEGGKTVERQGKTEEQQKQHPATPIDPDEAAMTAKLIERAPEVREALPVFMRDIEEWARRMSWLGTLLAAMDNPPHLSGALLARAMTQYVIRTPNPEDRSGRHFHAFCVDVARPANARASPAKGAERPRQKPADSAAAPYAAALSGDPDE